MPLTKSDIDALVDRMQRGGDDWIDVRVGNASWVHHKQLKEALYLAAGLTAEGERKPERVRCVQVVNPEYPNDRHFWVETGRPDDRFPAHYKLTSGWFVPDGEGA